MKLLHLLFLKMSNMKFKNKIISITTLTSLMIGVVSLASFWGTVSTYNRMLYQQTSNSLSYLADDISAQLETVSSTSYSITFNNTFQKNLQILKNSSNSSERSRATKDIREYLYRFVYDPISSISVYPMEGEPISWGSDTSQESEEMLNQIFQLCRKKPDKMPGWLLNKTILLCFV